MNRNPSLDVLRGVAILLVIGFHVGFPGIFSVGWVGVDLFFVLSGFLISGVLFRDFEEHGAINLARFWFRRAFKILPPLYIFLAFMAPLMAALRIFPGRKFLAGVFFFSNYLSDPNQSGRFVGHTWSLAVEEHFYLVFPLLLLFLSKHCRPRAQFRELPFIFVGVAVACFLLRWLDPAHWAFTHLRIDGIFAGVALRYLHTFRETSFRCFQKPWALAVGLTFWIPPCTFYQLGAGFRTVAYTWIMLSAACLVAWCFSNSGRQFWNYIPLRALAFVGFNSYSIYLWQGPLCLIALGGGPFFKSAGLILSVTIGTAMARMVEFPALAIRDQISTRVAGVKPVGLGSMRLSAPDNEA